MKQNKVMKKIVIILSFVLLIIVNHLYAQDYYWSGGKKIYLTALNNKYSIKIDTKVIDSTTLQFADSVVYIRQNLIVSNINDDTFLKTKNNIFTQYIPVYTLDDIELILTGEILLQPQNGITIDEITSICNNEVFIKSTSKYNTFTLEVFHWDSLFIYANKLYESGLVLYSQPNFIFPIEQTSDSLYSFQYYLNNTNNIGINVSDAWEITRSNLPVRVAVIDDGVEYHEDMGNRVLTGYTPSYSSHNPDTHGKPNNYNPSNDYKFGHGQACAGIICAEHNNNIGIKGIAPTSLILPVNIFNNWYLDVSGCVRFRESIADITNAIDYAWDIMQADVLSNSWGFRSLSIYSDAIANAIDRARTNGRNGKGAIVVFASGNSNNSSHGVTFPANLEGVIAVGSVDRNGDIWSYSSRGQNINLVAPSGNIDLQGDITTTDRMGIKGYENKNYTHRFGGSSAVCPQVTGVVALMLSENPYLTESEIKNILYTTAKDLGSTGYDTVYGYGLVNAFEAVKIAQNLFVATFMSGM